jgi:3-deoxy-D-manno-octulosonate 8-phosphate phosphatase (KDO 8-P phosphatase)
MNQSIVLLTHHHQNVYLMNVLEKFSAINTLIFDMDGVLTDGSLLVYSGDEWIRKMNVKDGYALQLAVKLGYNVIVVTGSSSLPVAERLQKLGIKQIFQKVFDKKQFILELLEKRGISSTQVMYMGDDQPDLPLLSWVGLSCGPADACRDVLETVDLITAAKGGEGCVREIIEKILRFHQKWHAHIDVAST